MYEKLLKETERNNIEVIEMPLAGKLKGLYSSRIIAINTSIDTNIEKACVLAEELGHYHTSSGNILDQSKLENRKQEQRARAWAYERLIGIIGLISAYKSGVRNRFELAEYLDVTEEFIEETIIHYKLKHGLFYKIDNYILYFDPLSVLEVWE